MALKIRLQRHGASHRPFYRMVVTEAAARRDGRFVEVLGTYEPQASKPENELKVKLAGLLLGEPGVPDDVIEQLAAVAILHYHVQLFFSFDYFSSKIFRTISFFLYYFSSPTTFDIAKKV